MKTPSADQLCIIPKPHSHEIYRSNPAYFQTIELHYHANALAIRALALLWAVERVTNQGYLSAKLQGQTSPHYLKRTRWLNNQDGFLVLDKNINGGLDNGEEMFSNSKVNEQNRGVASLAVIDGDGNGKIDGADAVFNNLVVWQDANGNGRMDDGEGKALAALGISSLNYEAGTVTRNGQASTQMHTLTLDADTLGTSFTPKGDGIVLQTTDGQTTLQVTKLRRLGEQVIVAPPPPGPPAPPPPPGSPPAPPPPPAVTLHIGGEAFTTDENVATVIQVKGVAGVAAGLIDDDYASDNSAITFNSVGNAQNGTVAYDAASGTVTFTPTQYYNGAAAGFDYYLNTALGLQTAHVQVAVTSVNQAPVITGVAVEQLPIYGYIVTETGVGINYDYTSAPMYSPGYGYAQPSPGGPLAYRDTVIAYEVHPNAGNATAYDVDGTGVSWSVASQGLHSTVAIDGNGRYVVSPQAVPGGGIDYFVLRATDPDGAYADRTVSVVLPVYVPPPWELAGTNPIVLDLNNTGFHFTSVDNSNAFLANKTDGWGHRTAWVDGSTGKGNGILAYDKFGDGRVHDSSQIAFKDYLPTAQTDLEGLVAFDSNHDGQITAADAKFGQLGVWVDVNNNGVGEAGEYKSLNELGITAINLTSDKQFRVDNGVTVFGQTSFTRADGSLGSVADVRFAGSADVLLTNADGSTRITSVAKADPENPIVVGDGNNLVLGYAGDNLVSVGNGNNMVSMGNGNDLITVGDGNNLIETGDGKDVVALGNGNNTVVLGQGPKWVVGGAGNNLVIGGGGNNLLMGGSGHDTLYAGNGNSLLYGGAGDDSLVNGLGHSALIGGEGNDVLKDGGGQADMWGGVGDDQYTVTNALSIITENAGEGIDSVTASIDYTLGGNLENLRGSGRTALTLTGNALNNQIIGNGAADTLIGGAGNDAMADSGGAASMLGGVGDDVYIVTNAAAVVTELVGEGTDTVKTSVSYALPAHVEKLIVTGNARLTLTGNDAGGTLVANNAGNTLLGGLAADVLTGGAGADLLDGGLGADTMAGGTGDDAYVVDNAGDIVTELAGEGADSVSASVDYTLTANLENLTLTGAATVGTGNDLGNVITGNDLGNTLSGLAGNDRLIGGASADILLGGDGADNLTGNAGADTLDGGAGADAMAGGLGNDSYVVDNAGDLVTELLGQGTDSVTSSINYTLTANVENLNLTGAATVGTGNELDNTLTANDLVNTLSGLAGDDTLIGGSGADTLLGGDGADSLTGNAGADRLDGGTGADTMTGGTGDDTYTVDNAGDTVTEYFAQGNDRVYSSINYVLPQNVEALILTGSAALNGTGNALDNVLIGNAASNSLYGLAGNDVMGGWIGADTLDGGTGDDTYLYSQGMGRDSLVDASGADRVKFGAGISLNSLSARDYTAANGQKRVYIAVLDANGQEQADQGIDFAYDVKTTVTQLYDKHGRPKGTSM